MENMDHVRERFEALEQQTEQLQHETQALKAHTRTVERRLRWWRLPWRWQRWRPSGSRWRCPLSPGEDLSLWRWRCSCLIAAINEANANGEANTIRLEAGTYTLTAVDNRTDGPNGLPR